MWRKRLILLAVFAICSAEPGHGQSPDLAALGARAEAGDPAAQVALGHAYRRAGLGAVATDWYCRAAAQGFPEGLYRCARDPAMLARAADLGHAPSAVVLGRLAEADDPALAERHFAQAAQLGSGEGAYRAGRLAERRGARDAAQGFWRRALALGHWPAANDLALALLNAPGRADEVRARALLAQAAEAGDQAARFNLAELSTDDPGGAYRLYALAGVGPNAGLRAAALDRLVALERSMAPDRIARLRADLAGELALTRERALRPADALD